MFKSFNGSFWCTAGSGGPEQGYQISKPQRSTVAQVGSWRRMGRGEQNIMYPGDLCLSIPLKTVWGMWGRFEACTIQTNYKNLLHKTDYRTN